MSSSATFCTFSVLRFVPDPLAQEFANVGLLVASRGNTDQLVQCEFAITSDIKRVAAFFPTASVEKSWSDWCNAILKNSTAAPCVEKLNFPKLQRSILHGTSGQIPFRWGSVHRTQDCSLNHCFNRWFERLVSRGSPKIFQIKNGCLSAKPSGNPTIPKARAKKRTFSMREIQDRVSEHFNIQPNDLVSQSRPRDVAVPRHVAMYLCREVGNWPLLSIAHSFGKDDHGTVINACKNVEDMMSLDPAFRDRVQAIHRQISA